MKVLALETSERIGSIAALEADGPTGQLLIETSLPQDRRAAQTLVPEIKTLLAELGWKPRDLDLIAVTTGPGSFTGVRLGVTTAKSMAYAIDAQVAGVHTLATIAAGVTQPFQRLWTILDAQRGELFVSAFESSEMEIFCGDINTRIVDAETWLDEVQQGDLVNGPALSKLADRLPSGALAVAEAEWKPRAAMVGRLGIATYQNGDAISAMQLTPQYYRKSAAEEKADQAAEA